MAKDPVEDGTELAAVTPARDHHDDTAAASTSTSVLQERLKGLTSEQVCGGDCRSVNSSLGTVCGIPCGCPLLWLLPLLSSLWGCLQLVTLTLFNLASFFRLYNCVCSLRKLNEYI
eukprot:TRINITY_DN1885_c0_g1_i1.p1 TRINITY_DN1885_c0_g1~~TRINITY_DN1885_c0_g1_i1.p1  ORF type:complete len:116 (+),score=2.35 TRINITY_DN1885_c0_g1_i1:17-364(+)